MKKIKKVVWKEGMFVTPHHFQQCNRYHEGVLNCKVSSYIPFNWGVIDLKIDKDALTNGNIIIQSLKIIMPDGLYVSIPETDQPPKSRSAGEYISISKGMSDIFIGIPVEKENALNCKDNTAENQTSRYITDMTSVIDDNTGGNEKDIVTARKNLKILFSGEILDDFITVKIAEVSRTSAGLFTLNNNYIPPCISISGSERLIDILKGLLDVLSAKSTSLSAQRRHKTYGVIEFGTSDISNFWLLHTVNSFIPILSHFYTYPQIHPERVYQSLIQLAGALTTFAAESNLNNIMKYFHTDQTITFEGLDKQIRALTETVIPTKSVQIPLERNKQTWVGRVTNDRLFSSARFYIAAQAEISEEHMRESLPKKIKVGALNDIDLIVNAAMPGLTISHISKPPSAIPVKMGCQYFLLDNHGEFWEPICKSKTFAFHISSDFKGIKLELMAVEE